MNYPNNTLIDEEMLRENEIKSYYYNLLPTVRIETREEYCKKFGYKKHNFYKRLRDGIMTQLEIDFIKKYSSKLSEKYK